MIRGAIYYDGSSPVFEELRYEVIDGTNVRDDGSTPVGDDSTSYDPKPTDVIILSPRGNLNCWAEWDGSNEEWRFFISDYDYVGFVFYTIHQAS